jgi:HK97 family phage portal protein
MWSPFRRSPAQRSEDSYGNVRGEDGTWYPGYTSGGADIRSAPSTRDERRSVTSVPWATGGPFSSDGIGQTTALTLSAIYSATDLLATSVATLPIRPYRRMANGDRKEIPKLPVLFDRLVEDGQLITWLRRCMVSILLRGNAYGLVVERDDLAYPTRIVWLSPDHVSVQDGAVSGPGSFLDPLWTYLGAPVAAEDMVHIPWYVAPEHTLGLSPIRAFASTIGVGIGAQGYAQDWFNNGGFPPGTFRNSQVEITTDQSSEISNRLTHAMRRRRPLVFGRDWEYTPITVPPDEAQFIATMRLSASQIAAIYHVPAEWAGGITGDGNLHYSTAEQDMIQMVTLGVRPYVELLECVFYSLLPPLQSIKFNLDALIRADLKTRHEVYALDASIGLRTIDEMRAQEDWAPLPEEDKPQPPQSVPPTQPGSPPNTVPNGQTPPADPAPNANGANGNSRGIDFIKTLL